MAFVDVKPSQRNSDEEDTIKRIDYVASLFGAKHSIMKVESADGLASLRYVFLDGLPVFVIRRSGWVRYVVFSNMDNQQGLENYLASQYKSGANFVLLDHHWNPKDAPMKLFVTVFLGLFLKGIDVSKLNRVNNLDSAADAILNSSGYVTKKHWLEISDVIKEDLLCDMRTYWPGCSIVGEDNKFVYELKIKRFRLSKMFKGEEELKTPKRERIEPRPSESDRSLKTNRTNSHRDSALPSKRVKREVDPAEETLSVLCHDGQPSNSIKREPISPEHEDLEDSVPLKRVKREPDSPSIGQGRYSWERQLPLDQYARLN